MKNKGTVAYMAVKLLRIIKANEKIIRPAHEALTAEWEKWGKESKEEMDRISADIDVDALQETFNELVDELSKETSKTNVREVHHSFLWFKWTQEVGDRKVNPKLEGVELHEAVLKALSAEYKGAGDVVYTTRHVGVPSSSFFLSLGCGHHPSKPLSDTHVLDHIHPSSHYMSYSYTEFEINIEGTILSPNKYRDSYRTAVNSLGKLRKLAELPDSELITLSDELAHGLDRVIIIAKELEGK